jgi:hypothetical protein
MSFITNDVKTFGYFAPGKAFPHDSPDITLRTISKAPIEFSLICFLSPCFQLTHAAENINGSIHFPPGTQLGFLSVFYLDNLRPIHNFSPDHHGDFISHEISL